MKKIFALAATAMMALAVNAQVYVGVGAGFGYDKDNTEGSKATTSFSIAPEVGYNINDKMAVGVDFSFNSLKAGDADAKNTINLDAYYRYNLCEAGSFKLFTEAAVGYETFGKDAGAATTIKVRPGALLSISDGVSLQARFDLFKYSMGNEDAGKVKTTNFGILNNANVQLGIVFNL